MVKVNFVDGRLIEFPLANRVFRDGDHVFLLHDVLGEISETVAEFAANDVLNVEQLPDV